ncbi:ABC transporter substrate-binding protein [Kibdelosporangium persicum]|uniref:ABC-type nitrate/sulfonate/bicarbonate transport system, periplasmic component n=1 Tax=Kibdelosporangium persicum TaxID=2698649 RepID=A0ABX2F0Z4_9PSEU|nr:ABC transporter substrate-binding protein [Kibdelosporangium persicum]NRN64893.1 ABC-type nitrate/sulfonate/bicarbonate transport system, periplasmic component [Kibdelosporangium persicum]
MFTARKPAGGVLRVAAVAVATTLLAAGCGILDGSSGDESGGNGQVEKPNVRIGIIASVDDAPVKVAEKLGFFKEEGLNAEVKLFQSASQTMPALSNGDLDFSLMNYVTYFQAASAKTLDAKIVADAYQGSPEALVMLARPGLTIASAKDFEGKKVSVHQPAGNIADLLFRATLRDNGADPSKVNYVPVAFPNIPKALETGQIDAGIAIEPFMTTAQKNSGAQRVLKVISGPTQDMPLSGYVSPSKFAQENPKTVAAFQRAMTKAQQAAGDRAKLAQVMPELTGVDEATVPLLNLGVFPTSLDATRLQRVISLMESYPDLSKLTERIQASSFIYNPPGS